MATTETVIGQTTDGRLIVYWENVGPDSYTTGGFTVTITTLKGVEAVVNVGNNGGYRTEAEEVTKPEANQLKIPAHYYGYACTDAPICVTGWEVEVGKDLSHYKFSGIVIGF